MFDPEYYSQTEEPKKIRTACRKGRNHQTNNYTVRQLTLPKPDNDIYFNYN